MVRSILLVPALCAAVILSGCKLDPAAQTVARFTPGARAIMSHAEYDGEYDLLQASVDSRGHLHPTAAPPIITLHLIRHQPLGFALNPNDSANPANAIAGE